MSVTIVSFECLFLLCFAKLNLKTPISVLVLCCYTYYWRSYQLIENGAINMCVQMQYINNGYEYQTIFLLKGLRYTLFCLFIQRNIRPLIVYLSLSKFSFGMCLLFNVISQKW